jgi:putative ATP-dependent endonuclease of the OLD family
MAKKKAATEEPTQSVDPRIPRPRLHKLRVSNFRCIGPDPVEIELDDIVVLVGPNNAGKSSILRAYEIVMKHGSAEGEMAIDDFPHGHVTPGQEPTIELETVVFEKSLPGEKWVRTDPQTNEMFVREKWM